MTKKFYLIFLINLLLFCNLVFAFGVIIGETGSLSNGGFGISIVIPEPTPITNGSTVIHNNLTGLQGGSTNQFFHLNKSVHDTVNNNFLDWLTESSADNIFLRLDASNDPITGNLTIDGNLNVTGDLFVSNDTIFIGGVTLKADDNNLILDKNMSAFAFSGDGSQLTNLNLTNINFSGGQINATEFFGDNFFGGNFFGNFFGNLTNFSILQGINNVTISNLVTNQLKITGQINITDNLFVDKNINLNETMISGFPLENGSIRQRQNKTGMTYVFERLAGNIWEVITTFGSSVTSNRFILDDPTGRPQLFYQDPTNGLLNLARASTIFSGIGTEVGSEFGHWFGNTYINTFNLTFIQKRIGNITDSVVQNVSNVSILATSLSYNTTTPGVLQGFVFDGAINFHIDYMLAPNTSAQIFTQIFDYNQGLDNPIWSSPTFFDFINNGAGRLVLVENDTIYQDDFETDIILQANTTYLVLSQFNTTVNISGSDITGEFVPWFRAEAVVFNQLEVPTYDHDSRNFTIGQKLTFGNGEIIDNLIDGLIRIFANVFIDGELDMNNNNITNILSSVYNITGCTDDTAGTLCYDADFDTLRFVTTSGQILQINQESTMPGKNTEGSTVLDGSIVYVDGAIGINPTFKLAKADFLNTSGLLGVITKDCINNQVCPIVYFGLINMINTSNFTTGDHLYLSDSEAGNFTTTPPEFPSNPIWVATAIRIHGTDGSIFVFPRLDSANGITMDTLGLVGDFIQTDYKIRSLEGHANLGGKNVMCIEMNGTTGEDVCHLVLQPGGVQQASIWVRSGLVVPENLICLNNTNRTDAQCWADAGGFSWNIVDFNTTNTEGADWGITGELEVVKSAYIGENLNVSGNITSSNVFISQYIFVHTNVTLLVNDVNEWTNITFDQEITDIKQGIIHDGLSITNHTFTFSENGIYLINFDLDIEDTSPGATDIDVAARIIFINGTEIPGSVFEIDVIKQETEFELSHHILASFNSGDTIILQFIASDSDVQISTHGSYGDHPDSASMVINKVANVK